MRLVKRESNGLVHVKLNRRESTMGQQIIEMMHCHSMRWNTEEQEFYGVPDWGYQLMKTEIMHDIREYRSFFDVINFKCIRCAEFDYKVGYIDDMYSLYVTDGIKWYYAGQYHTDWFEQYFIDNTNILERRGQ